jgi:possible site-specific DNA-methyltransferase (adenine-specific)
MSTVSETITEKIFRDFYKKDNFIEKSGIPKSYGFKSKRKTGNKGYPDFFLDEQERDFIVIVETKALKHSDAEEEVKWYMEHNTIKKTIVGIAVSGQEFSQIKVSYYYKIKGEKEIIKFHVKDKLLSIDNIERALQKRVNGEIISDEELIKVIKDLNKKFNLNNRVRSTDRSLFFSGLIIALTNNNFRKTFEAIEAPSEEEVAKIDATILEAYNLNEAILTAIEKQISIKINNLSKEYVWKDKFSFIRNIDYSLEEYKEIIKTIRDKVYIPFKNEEKQDILGKAYKLFLGRGGKAEDKNIILTPDHIKELMVKLARLTVDDVVLDTCMGSGGFLMEAMEIITHMLKDDVQKINNVYEKQLIGFEVDSVLFALACSNMYLHGDGRSNLLYRSSLLHSDNNGTIVNNKDQVLYKYVKELKPTKCIINPPYELDSPIKFTVQALKYIEDNGKLVIIMPTPTLNKHKSDLTQDVLEMAKLDYVIKMPYNLFNEQGRTVNTSIFGFTKTPHQPNDEVLFVNLKEDGFESIQHKGRVDANNKWNDIENKILDIINNSKEEEGLSTKKKIYRKKKNSIDELELYPTGIPTKKVGKDLVKLGDLFDFDKKELFIEGTSKLQSSKNDDNGKYDFITAADEWKKHTEYSHDVEALIYAVSAGGSLGKSQYVNGKFICSNLCTILTKKENSNHEINMRFFNEYLNRLREDIVDSLADGTSKLTIKNDELLEYYIEYIPIAQQNKYVSDYLDKLDDKKKELENMKLMVDEAMDTIIKKL